MSDKKLVCGFGINDAGYVVQRKYKTADGKRKTEYCPFYRKWQNMLERCYSQNLNYSTYEKTQVCEEWKYFSNFKRWMEKKDWEGMCLDKDLLGDGTLYSPSTCCFIDNQTNVFIRETINSSQGLAKGVHKDKFPKKSDNKFLIYCQDVTLKKRVHIGYSNTEKRASDIYKSYLNYYGSILSKRYKEVDVVNSLYNLSKYERKKIPDEILYFQEKVVYFNEVFGNKVEDKTLIQTYKDLTDEELNGDKELLSSYADKDWEGVLDGVCDTIFTGFMLLNLVGEKFEEGYYIPITEVKGINRYDFKLLEKSFTEGNYEFFKRALINLVVKVSVISDLKKAFDRVYESNMSKAISKDKGLPENFEKSLEAEGRYKNIWVESTEDFIVVKAGEDLKEGKIYPSGKIMKGDWYTSVEDLGGLDVFVY